MNEIERVRDLAKRTRELADSDANQRKRALWADVNSLIFHKPPVYVIVPEHEIVEPGDLKCEDPLLRSLEKTFLVNEYHRAMDDDCVIEPFVMAWASHDRRPSEGPFGLKSRLGEAEYGSAAAFDPSLIEESDIDKLWSDDYSVNEESTARTYQKYMDVLGGILDVGMMRVGWQAGTWVNDISTCLAQMRGLTQMMLDIYDRPEWLHDLVGRMQKMILKSIDQTEAGGGFNRACHNNQVSPYARELPWPSADPACIRANQVWAHIASQEFTIIGPAAYKEFLFDYQKPIMERFGLVAYGCCEDLTEKIDLLRTVKSVRRIAVTQLADLRKCAERIGGDYVLSWRPNPSPHVCFHVEEDFVRREMREAFQIFDACGCKFDILMKSCQTLSGDRSALIRWVRIVREEIGRRYE